MQAKKVRIFTSDGFRIRGITVFIHLCQSTRKCDIFDYYFFLISYTQKLDVFLIKKINLLKNL